MTLMEDLGPISPERRNILWTPLLVLLLAAAGVRALFVATPGMDGDMAITGLMARHILEGEWPVFFWGQAHGGALESYVIALFYAVFGMSRVVTNAAVAAQSMVFLCILFLLGRRIGERHGARLGLMALSLASLGPFYLIWHSNLARANYVWTMILAAWLMLQTLRLLDRQRPVPAGGLFLWGFIAGLAVWQHFMSLFFLAPCGWWLLGAAGGWRGLTRLLGWSAAGLLVGASPLIAYNLVHPLATVEFVARPVATLPPLASLRVLWDYALPVFTGALWDSGRAVAPWSHLLPWVCLAATVWVLLRYAGGLVGALVWRPSPAAGPALAAAVLICGLALYVQTGVAGSGSARYLVPLYAALPLLLAIAANDLCGLSRVLGYGALALLLWALAWGTLSSATALHPERYRAFWDHQAQVQALGSQLESQGPDRLYAQDFHLAFVRTFDWRERVIVADPVGNMQPAYQRAVTGAARAGWITEGDPAVLERAFAGLAVQGRRLQQAGMTVFHDWRPPPRLRQLPATEWRAAASTGAGEEPLAWDRDLSTRWATHAPQSPGQSFTLDLGQAVEGVCRLRLWAGRRDDNPVGLMVSTSPDGEAWEPAASLNPGDGAFFWSGGKPMSGGDGAPVEAGFTPRTARLVRLVQTGDKKRNDWSIMELAVYATDGGPWPAMDPAAAAEAARESAGPDGRVLAPPAVAAHLPRPEAQAGAASLAQSLEEAGGFKPELFLVHAEDEVLVCAPRHADQAGTMLEQVGWGFRRREAGGMVIFHYLGPAGPLDLTPLPATDWRASSEFNPRGLGGLSDGDAKTRWDSGRAQEAGMYLEIVLSHPTLVAGLDLDAAGSPRDFARGLVLEARGPEGMWRAVAFRRRLEPPLYFNGSLLLTCGRPRETLLFAPLEAAALRLTLTAGHPVNFWSIHELSVLTPGAGSGRQN